MKSTKKILESKTLIRFQDCDPFRHLNNSKYIDYMINAREDQLVEDYGINIFDYATETGNGWMVVSNKIGYLKAATPLETVTIQSQLIHYDEKLLRVEIRMLDEAKTHCKAVMWSDFLHVNLGKGSVAMHLPEYMELFESVVTKIDSPHFDLRAAQLRKGMVTAKS